MYRLIAIQLNESLVWGKTSFEEVKKSVALFSSKLLAEEYVESCRLDKYPNSKGKFRRDSLLGGADRYEIEKIEKLPINPKPLDGPPQIEYIVRHASYNFSINCGQKIENAEKEIAEYGDKDSKIIEQFI